MSNKTKKNEAITLQNNLKKETAMSNKTKKNEAITLQNNIKKENKINKKEIKNYAKEHNCSIREAQRQLGVEPTGNFKDSVEKKDGLKKVKLSEIKTPTTVDEFRDNLKKYFGGYSEDELYVLPSVDGNAISIKYEDINSLNDIYEITGELRPHIIPLIEFDMNDVSEHMTKTHQTFSAHGFFHDDYEVYENALGILMKMKKSSWFTLDNQILREFYMKVCGEFSGYGLLKEVA